MNARTKLLRISAVILLLSLKTALPVDLNGDGEINSADCQKFLEMLASGTAAGRSDLDINKDGVTDLKDALLFGQWVNGLWNDPESNFSTLYSSCPQDTVAYNNYMKNSEARKESWTVDDLKKAYPDNTGKGNLDYDSAEVEFSAQVRSFFNSPEYLARVLEKGIAVFSGESYPNFYSAFDIIHTKDLPVIFTTDAMLQTIYRSYDNILLQLETARFKPQLEKILRSSLAYLKSRYAASDHVNDVATYFETALKLLNPSFQTSQSDVSAIITAISAEQMSGIRLFGRMKTVDFSQFKPRGHYTSTGELQNYFRAMMWLSRADLAFEIGGSPEEDLSRMKKGALVTWDCVVNSGTLPEWLELNRIIEYMVGTGDGLTVRGMGNLVHDMGVVDMTEFVAAFDENKFDSAVVAGSYGVQMILSEYKEYDGMTDELALSRIFNFMPQRFIVDSYALSQLVFPLTPALLPSSLDIAFLLGDNTALEDRTDMQSTVPGVLGSLRDLFDGISPAGWQSNMYTSWMNFLRQLSGAERNKKVAPVFRTLTWAKKMRNTQLTSWAQLRHNTILYAKQSYTGSITCSHPKAYVEPYPDFFKAVAVYAGKGETLFGDIDAQVAGFFKDVADISTRLSGIAQLTAQGGEPTAEQVEWLRSIVSSHSVGGSGYNTGYKIYDGWYFDLVYDNEPEHKSDGWVSFTTIADVHTKPADERGPALVLHAATGYVNLMTVAVEIDSCITLFVGPVGSYYDVVTSSESPRRLNDEEWEGELTAKLEGRTSIATKPAWTEIYTY